MLTLCLPSTASSLPSLALPSRLRDGVVQNGQQGRRAAGGVLSRVAQVLGGHVPEWSKAVKSAALEAASLRARGSGWAPSKSPSSWER